MGAKGGQKGGKSRHVGAVLDSDGNEELTLCILSVHPRLTLCSTTCRTPTTMESFILYEFEKESSFEERCHAGSRPHKYTAFSFITYKV